MLDDIGITAIIISLLLTLPVEQRASIKKYINLWCKAQYKLLRDRTKENLSYIGVNNADELFNKIISDYAEALNSKDSIEGQLEKLVSLIKKTQ